MPGCSGVIVAGSQHSLALISYLWLESPVTRRSIDGTAEEAHSRFLQDLWASATLPSWDLPYFRPLKGRQGPKPELRCTWQGSPKGD